MIENRDNQASICFQCVDDLVKADFLRMKCLKADEYFRSVIPADFFKHAFDVMVLSKPSEDPISYNWNHNLEATVKQEIVVIETTFSDDDVDYCQQRDQQAIDENIFGECSQSMKTDLKFSDRKEVKKAIEVGTNSVVPKTRKRKK